MDVFQNINKNFGHTPSLNKCAIFTVYLFHLMADWLHVAQQYVAVVEASGWAGFRLW